MNTGIVVMRPIDHIRARLGMYVQTRNNKPTDDAWWMLLDELAADGVRAFAKGDASRLEIRYSEETGEVAIGHDGPDGDICNHIAASFRGEQGNVSNLSREVYLTRYDWMTYAILNALSSKMTVETYDGGEWQVNVCRDGKIGFEERMMAGLLPEGCGRFVWIRFIVDPKFLEEGKGLSPYSKDALQDFGRRLACAHQGLRVIVNNHEYMFQRGITDMVAERMARLDSEVLMQPRTVCSDGVMLACGIVRQRNPGRRISGTAFINGREIKRSCVLATLNGIADSYLADCPLVDSSNCEFVFVASGKVSAKDGEDIGFAADICSWPWSTGDSEYVAKRVVSQYVSSFTGCLDEVLGEFTKKEGAV